MNTKHAILISMTKICKKDNRRNAIEGQDFFMKVNFLCCIVGAVLGFARVEGAFEEANPLQSEHIAMLMEKSAYDPEEIKSYDLNEIYIAGALLSEGWGCSQGRDEKKALQLYRAALEALRKEPMDMDVVWNEGMQLDSMLNVNGLKILNIFKAELDQVRRPFVLYAMIGDTLRLLLRQGRYEEALQLMEESRRMTLLKGKEIEEAKPGEADAKGAREADRVVHFYESVLNDGAEEGHLFLEALFYQKMGNRRHESQAQSALYRNMILGELVVRGFERKPVEEKLKAFPYVLRNAKLGIPQAMEAMHRYYKSGCGFLPSDKAKAEEWLKKSTEMKRSYSPSELNEDIRL